MTGETRSEVVKKGQEIQKATPTHALTPFDEMERMFERIFPRGWLRPMQWEWPSWSVLPTEAKLPCVDVIERDDELLIRAELPGVDKKDIDVSVTDSSLTIRATTRREEKEEKGDYYRHEIAQGAFARTVTLPAEVDSEHARAAFKDGMLELHLPKIEKAKRRSITLD